MSDGETLVAEARSAASTSERCRSRSRRGRPRPRSAGRKTWTTGHPFPTCFVCGPRGDHGDGLDIFPVELEKGRWVATWTPEEPGMVWPALDCPTAAPLMNPDKDPPIVLARLAAAIDEEPAWASPT